MGALAQLSATSLDVEPGRSATVTLTVRNTGTVVDRFSFDVVGPAGPWAAFYPETLSLFPEASGTVTVTFAPPRQSSVAAGPVPIGIRVLSSEDPGGSTVEEATLNVGAFSEVSLELLPPIPTGRTTARARLAVDNRSNCPYRAELSVSDPREALRFALKPVMVDVPAGGVVFSRLQIRPVKSFWRGPAKTHNFRVLASSGPPADRGVLPGDRPPPYPGPPPAAQPERIHPAQVAIDASMVQEAILPAWLLKAVAALVALAALLALLWFTLFRPQIRSTAKDAARQQLAAAGISPTTAAGSGAGAGGGSATQTIPPGTTVPPVTAPPPVTTPSSPAQSTTTTLAPVPINGSYVASGNSTTTLYTVPSGQVLEITDLLVQNPGGASGTLSITRSGTVLMQFSLADFRDLDYHWITPTVFDSGSTLQMVVQGCSGPCTPGVYYSGTLTKG